MEPRPQPLTIVVFPWLAKGHLIPFLRLSKHLSQKGHKVLFISTIRNIHNLPQTPLVTLVSISLPQVPGLPPHAESSSDIPYNKQQILKKAFDLLEAPVRKVLEETKPDWIVYDYASHWLPSMAAELGVKRVFFSLFTAATLAFIGPPDLIIRGGDGRSTAEDLTVVPRWIPFKTDMAFRLHEVTKHAQNAKEDVLGTPDIMRFAIAAAESNVVAIRSPIDIEPQWYNLLNALYKKPILSLGCLHPNTEEDDCKHDDEDIDWVNTKRWLDKQKRNSVVYVAVGTEVSLTQEELETLALGLEQSELPFFWVVKSLASSTMAMPNGFEDRIKDRGIVYRGWAPQVKILSHDSIGGLLTHCGWNSVIEGLGFGRVLILLPILNDQGLNSRLLSSMRVGVEVDRNEKNGSFTCHSVAKSIRLAMVDGAGDLMRVAARRMQDVFGNKVKNESGVNEFVHFLEKNRP